jgi:hypothetical protein
MKMLTIAGIPTLLVLCVGIAVGQDAAQDANKAANKTGHVVKHATTKVDKVTKRGPKTLTIEPRSRSKTQGKVSRPVWKRLAAALRIRLPSSRRIDCWQPGESMAQQYF